MSENDISNKVIVSLLLLTVVITFIGTMLVFSSLNETSSVSSYNNQGKVGINIIQDPTPEDVIMSGKVGINIQEAG